MKYLNKLIVFLITLTLTMAIIGGVTLGAEKTKDITIRSLDVLIMPEYDTPDLLEVNTVTMYNNSDKPFQGELVWRIPKGATNVVVVKNEDVNATTNKSLGQVRTGPQYDELNWTPSTAIPAKSQATWHIEYYDPTSIQGTTDKTFTFDYQQPYEVNMGAISILQPTKATNFTTQPTPGNQESTQQGNILSFPLKAIKPDEVVSIKASYTKTDPNPSFSNNSAQSGQEQTQANQPTVTKDNTMLYALIGLIIIIAAAAILIIMKNDVKNERRDIIEKRIARKSPPDFYDDTEEFDEFHEYEEDNHDIENEQAIEDHQEFDAASKTKDAKKALRAKFEKGLITEVDYYEQLADLEE